MSPSQTRTQRLQAHLALNAASNGRVQSTDSGRSARSRTLSASTFNNVHATIALSLLVVGAGATPINLSADGVGHHPAVDLATNVRQILTGPQQASFAAVANAALHSSVEDLSERFDEFKSTVSHFLENASGLVSSQQTDITPSNDGLQLVTQPAPEANHEALPALTPDVDVQGSTGPLPVITVDDTLASPISSEPDSPRIMPGDFPTADYTPPPASNNQTIIFASAGAASLSLLFAIAAVQSIRQLRASSKKRAAAADIEAAPTSPQEDLSRALIVREKGIKWAREPMVTNEKGEDNVAPRRLVPRGARLAQKKSVEDLMGTDVPTMTLTPLAPAKLAPVSASDPVMISEKPSQLVPASTTPSTARPPQLAQFPTAANLDLTLLHLPVTMNWMFHFVLVFFGWFGFVSRPGIARALVNSF